MPSGEYGVTAASKPSARRAASAASRVALPVFTRRSSGAGASHAWASAERVASPYAAPSRSHSQSGTSCATAGGSGCFIRDLNARTHSASAVFSAGSRSRSERPSSRTNTASASLRGSVDSASVSVERIRRSSANTPSATNARSR